MVELFVFEGYINWRPNNWEHQETRLEECRKKIENAVKPLTLPNSFLRRNLKHVSEKRKAISRIDNIREFLCNCLKNGHDRIDPNKWNRYSGAEERAKGKGLNANDIIWAHLYTAESEQYYDRRFYFYSWDPEDYYTLPNDNDGILIINSQAYTAELDLTASGHPLLFSQPDIEKRKEALLGIILFDNGASPLYPRPDLRFRLNEKTFQKVLREIRRVGYFAD